MKHPIVISSLGETGRSSAFIPVISLQQLKAQIDSWNLTPSRVYMNEADYLDIVAWGKSDNQ